MSLYNMHHPLAGGEIVQLYMSTKKSIFENAGLFKLYTGLEVSHSTQDAGVVRRVKNENHDR